MASGHPLAPESVLALPELPHGQADPGQRVWLYAVAWTHFHAARAEFETLFIRRMLRAAGGNLSRAARMMTLNRRSLQREVREYEIDVEEFRAGISVRQQAAVGAAECRRESNA